MKKIIRYYKTHNGNVPFDVWFKQLLRKNKKEYLTVYARLNRIAGFGAYGDVKSVGDGVFELRFFFGSGQRVYFGEDGDAIVILLCAGDKSSQKRDIEQAKQYWREYNAR